MSEEAKTRLYQSGILLLSILGVGIVLIRQTNYGVGLMVDSLTHTSTAESLLRGEGFITAWNSRPQQGQPPLYALWLSLFATLDVINKYSIVVYTGYAGAILFGLTILAAIGWIAARVKSRMMVIIGGGVCTLSPFLGDLFNLALTETLFLLVIVLSLFSLDRFLGSNKRAMLILAASFSASAWLTRHIGVTIIISSILILMAKSGSTFRQKLNSIAIYSSISILPTSLWMSRNYIALGQLRERYWSTGFDWSTSLNLTSSEITKWLVGTTGLNYFTRSSETLGIDVAMLRIMFLGFIVVSVGLGLIYLYRRGVRIDTRGLVVPVVFISVYSVALAASLILTDVDVEMRYLSPLYVPIVVAIMIALGQYCNVLSTNRRSMWELPKLKLVIVAGLSLHLVLMVSSSYDQITTWRNQGSGYSSKQWTDSETIGYLESSPMRGRIYSNEARAVYTHINASDEAEIYIHQLQAELPDEVRYWDDSAHAQNLELYVVWFHGWRPFIQTQYDIVQLISSYNLEIVSVFEDGMVLRSSRNFDADAHIDDSKRVESLVLNAILNSAQIIAHSEFDVYLADSKLIYIATCSGVNTEHPFFLHIFPTNLTDISNHRTDFNNHDFRFSREGFSFGERCAVIRNLPSYDIKMIRTGQFSTDEVELWEESFYPQAS